MDVRHDGGVGLYVYDRHEHYPRRAHRVRVGIRYPRAHALLRSSRRCARKRRYAHKRDTQSAHHRKPQRRVRCGVPCGAHDGNRLYFARHKPHRAAPQLCDIHRTRHRLFIDPCNDVYPRAAHDKKSGKGRLPLEALCTSGSKSQSENRSEAVGIAPLKRNAVRYLQLFLRFEAAHISVLYAHRAVFRGRSFTPAHRYRAHQLFSVYVETATGRLLRRRAFCRHKYRIHDRQRTGTKRRKRKRRARRRRKARVRCGKHDKTGNIKTARRHANLSARQLRQRRKNRFVYDVYKTHESSHARSGGGKRFRRKRIPDRR